MTFSNPIVGGTTLIRPSIHSPDYVAGTTGWTINKDGTAEFNDVTFRGSAQSANYVAGVSGWKLDQGGDAEFNSVQIRSTGTATPITVGGSSSPQVQVSTNANVASIKLPTNGPVENDIAQILSGRLNSGLPNEAETLQIFGPTVDGATDRSSLLLNSQNNDGSSQANLSLKTGTASLVMDKTLMTVQGPRVNVSPSDSGSTALQVTTSGTYAGSPFKLIQGAKELLNVNSVGRLTIAPNVSANAAVFVNCDTGYTGDMLRLAENGIDVFRVANDGATTVPTVNATDLAVSNNFTARNIQCGQASVTTVASQWVEVSVTFSTAFLSTPTVQVTGNNNAPAVGGTTQLYHAVTGITTTGFTLRVFRSTAITMIYGWTALTS